MITENIILEETLPWSVSTVSAISSMFGLDYHVKSFHHMWHYFLFEGFRARGIFCKHDLTWLGIGLEAYIMFFQTSQYIPYFLCRQHSLQILPIRTLLWNGRPLNLRTHCGCFWWNNIKKKKHLQTSDGQTPIFDTHNRRNGTAIGNGFAAFEFWHAMKHYYLYFMIFQRWLCFKASVDVPCTWPRQNYSDRCNTLNTTRSHLGVSVYC